MTPTEAMTDPPGNAVVELRPGRREANKREKLLRIRAAARKVFVRDGFESAAIREIATEADVALGTLFLYAKNKQDLLLLLFDEEFLVMGERAFGEADPADGFVDQVIAFFNVFYLSFAQTPALSRDMLREITFSTGGIVAARIWASLRETEEHLAKLVARAQSHGAISSDLTPSLAAHVIFSLYRTEVRACMDSDAPDVDASLDRLRAQLAILLDGLRPRIAREATVTAIGARRQVSDRR